MIVINYQYSSILASIYVAIGLIFSVVKFFLFPFPSSLGVLCSFAPLREPQPSPLAGEGSPLDK